MIQIVTLNENNKIELTKEELQKMLEDAYREGYYTARGYNGYIYNNGNAMLLKQDEYCSITSAKDKKINDAFLCMHD